MAQHFLLSSAAKSLSIATVARMSEEEAWEAFRLIRWAATEGEPACPRCGCLDSYRYKTRKIFRCKGCSHQFTVTSATTFASRKLPIRDYLLAIAIFVNGAKGHSALQLSRDLSCNYKSAYVLAMKLREAVAAGTDDQQANGHVEIDGGYFGGYIKPANVREKRSDRRFLENKSGKRRVVIVMRERNGKTLPFVAKSLSLKMRPFQPLKIASPLAARFMPTKPHIGMNCTGATLQRGSIIPFPTQTAIFRPIRPKAS
jgi:transposase-like protein